VLDETTYYISAFAVDSNDTIINVQNSSVTTNFIFSKYQKVEYIESHWTNSTSWQYINTGIIPNSTNTTVKLRTMPMNSSYSVYVCACLNSNLMSDWSYYWLSFTAKRWHCWSWNSSYAPWNPIVDFSYNFSFWNTIYDIEYRNDDLYINNSLVANATSNVQSFWYPMFLFARNNTWSVWSCCPFRLYSCEIYQSNVLVRNFVPCYRKSDNVIWLLDIVNKVFYTNQWSWSFTKWPNV